MSRASTSATLLQITAQSGKIILVNAAMDRIVFHGGDDIDARLLEAKAHSASARE